MIRVEYDRDACVVRMTGHAGSAEPGRDLVCAAASILAFTIAENVIQLCDSGYAENCVVKLESGDAEIGCSPHAKYESMIQMVIDSICEGFGLLSSKYPDYISFGLAGEG